MCELIAELVGQGETKWAKYLETASHKELAESVRTHRWLLLYTDASSPEGRKAYRRGHGRALYELQVALRTRFRIDIAKVR